MLRESWNRAHDEEKHDSYKSCGVLGFHGVEDALIHLHDAVRGKHEQVPSKGKIPSPATYTRAREVPFDKRELLLRRGCGGSQAAVYRNDRPVIFEQVPESQD